MKSYSLLNGPLRALSRSRGLALVLGVVVAAGSLLPGAVGASTAGFLRYANATASYAYKLKLAKSCEVGDGLAVVKNVGTAPLRLTSLAVIYGKGARADQEHTTFSLISLRRGTSEGQLGATFDLGLTGVDGGTDLGRATGQTLLPIASSGRSYDLVADILVVNNHPKPWKIDGLRVTYAMSGHVYSTVLAQSITLISTLVC